MKMIPIKGLICWICQYDILFDFIVYGRKYICIRCIKVKKCNNELCNECNISYLCKKCGKIKTKHDFLNPEECMKCYMYKNNIINLLYG